MVLFRLPKLQKITSVLQKENTEISGSEFPDYRNELPEHQKEMSRNTRKKLPTSNSISNSIVTDIGADAPERSAVAPLNVADAPECSADAPPHNDKAVVSTHDNAVATGTQHMTRCVTAHDDMCLSKRTYMCQSDMSVHPDYRHIIEYSRDIRDAPPEASLERSAVAPLIRLNTVQVNYLSGCCPAFCSVVHGGRCSLVVI